MEEKNNDIELLDMIIEKGSKGAIERLQEINSKLSENIKNGSYDESRKLLIEQNKLLKGLILYFDKK